MTDNKKDFDDITDAVNAQIESDIYSQNEEDTQNNDISSHSDESAENNDISSHNDESAENNDISSHSDESAENNDISSHSDESAENNDISSHSDESAENNDISSHSDESAENNDISSHSDESAEEAEAKAVAVENDYDIYSNSKIDDRDDFSLELEIERSRMEERFQKEQSLKTAGHMHIFQDAENVQSTAPSKTSFSAKNLTKAINGISYKTLKRKRSLSHVLLNNGEPLPFALRSMALQLGALILCTAAILVCIIGFNFFVNSAENNSLAYFSVSRDYQTAVKTDTIQAVSSSRADLLALNTLLTWANADTVSQSTLDTDVLLNPKTLETQISTALPDYEVTLKEGLSNYDLIAQIYESLTLETPVLVSCTTNFSVIADEATISYALIVGMDPRQGFVTLIDETGTQKQVSFDAFIQSTRFDNIENASFSDNLNFLFGNYIENSAIFLIDIV